MDAFLLGDSPSDGKKMPDELFVHCGDVIGGLDMLVRNDQHVGWCNRVYVPEGGHLLVLVQLFAGKFASDDPAECTSVYG